MPPPRHQPDARNLVMSSGRRIPRPDPPKPRAGERPDPAPEPPEELKQALERAGAELEALSRIVASCTQCSRREGVRVHGSGYARAPVMLVKDAPGEADLAAATAFTAEADALQRAFEHLGVPFGWVYGTTAVRCGDGPATLDEAKSCASHLLVELETVQPSVIVAFGDRALDALRALDGRCGLRVPDDPARGEPVALRPGLRLLVTEPLPQGVTEPAAKRRLWKDLQRLPELLR